MAANKTRKKSTAARSGGKAKAPARKANDPAPKKRRKAARKANDPAPKKRRKTARKATAPAPTKRKKSGAARRPNAPARNKVGRKRNPTVKGFFAGLFQGIVEAGKAAVVLLPSLALKNGIGGIKTKTKNAAGVEVEVTIAERVGPWYDLLANTTTLLIIPPVLPMVGLKALQGPGTWALRINWLISALKTAQFYARHSWDKDKPALVPGATDYPGWSDLLDVGSKSLQGTSTYVGGHYFSGRQPLALPGGGPMGMYPSTSVLDAQYAAQGGWRQ